MLFSEPKIPQSRTLRVRSSSSRISVLFSEPKIPQCSASVGRWANIQNFSALQRAENSSIVEELALGLANVGFQCSSASRKFLNFQRRRFAQQRCFRISVLFSEPKIPQCDGNDGQVGVSNEFQCSSASRKFLNSVVTLLLLIYQRHFSALQRAENSSIARRSATFAAVTHFSALQRAENSSMKDYAVEYRGQPVFQCSSASRKFLNRYFRVRSRALQCAFQCSSASRKFLNRARATARRCSGTISVLFSEPKIPQ